MKKLLSALLAVLLLVSTCTVAFAAPDPLPCTCGHAPVVYITGFAMTDLVANPGTKEEYDVFMPESDKINTAVKGLISPLVQVLFLHNYKAFARSLSKAVHYLLDELAYDDNGEPLQNNIGIAYDSYASSYHGYVYAQNTFRYDWRQDVFDIADQLNDFIEEVKRLSRHDKVILKGESMGGAVLMTYLKVYGHDSVDTIIMQSSAFNGISLVGDLFTGDLDIKLRNALDYGGNFLEGDENTTNFYRLLMKRFGFLAAPVTLLLDHIFAFGGKVLYAECLNDLFGNIPGIWVFVPMEKYEAAKAFLLDETVNAKLIEKLDRYHYGVMDSTKELLDSAMADGVKLAILSNYGKAGIPVGSHAPLQSDFLVDTRRTSYGATCADFGKTLGKKYTQAVQDGHDHISCDRVVDASTCLYPEYTWFIKDMMHTWYTAGYREFTYWIGECDTQPTVHDNPLYPQFLYNDQENRTLVPLTPENSDNRPTKVNWKDLIQYFRDQRKKAH